jgi:hypothetical protein
VANLLAGNGALRAIGGVWAFVALSGLVPLLYVVGGIGAARDPRELYLGSKLLTFMITWWPLLLATVGGFAAMFAFLFRYRWGLYLSLLLSMVWLVAVPLRLTIETFKTVPLTPVRTLWIGGLLFPPLCMAALCLLPSVRSAMNR